MLNGSDIKVNNSGSCFQITIPAGDGDSTNTSIIINGTRLDVRSCRFWNEGKKQWSTDGCKINLNMTNINYTVCCCDHMTFFSVNFGSFDDFVVPVKKIDFSNTEGLENIEDNRIVFVLCCLYFLFSILIVLMFKMDLMDIEVIEKAMQRRIKKIYDTCYIVSVFTGDLPGAGTDSKVYVTIHGKRAAIKDHRLRSYNFKNKFERKSRDDFAVSYPTLGAIERLTIRHDNTGMYANWYLAKVEILDTLTGDVYVFKAEKWLKDKTLEITLSGNYYHEMCYLGIY